MNYMKMVCFNGISRTKASARFIFKDNEAINELDKPLIVPYFMIMEAIFQTAGRVAREYSGNKAGGYIVNFSDFNLSRPVLSNELVSIKADLISFHEQKKCFFFNIYVSKSREALIQKGELIMRQDTGVDSQYLNNSTISSARDDLRRIFKKI